ncbi:hypothetical protein DSO57_1004681 [Entomophthora muscae]|uniref:Uncharacterized protein n=2 Tax=Entomophthora muscae TaxID=34485 RepID=A0ACC2TT83_9FUNG|nr:hypothetical protein DSO57_1013435 [Entomophthora muscae]KAJ9082421.1 hypothetical protein DSO57_1004681 [Entomophthora muscae]
MQFTNAMLKITVLITFVLAESELCNLDHSGAKQRCSVQFKHDARSMDKFDEVADHLKKMECSWISDEDLRFHKPAMHIATNLPAGFVDAVLAKLPQYQPYVASKTCD